MDHLNGLILVPRGEHLVSKAIEIGSMRVMGCGNLIVLTALAAFYNYVFNLPIFNFLKQYRFARTASVGHISNPFHDRADK
jgi:uncharacterized membrane protein